MKNNFTWKVIFFWFFNKFLSAHSEELRFEATSIELEDKDKIITAKQGVKILSGDEIIIDADNMIYNKEKNFFKLTEILLSETKEKTLKSKVMKLLMTKI